MLCHRTVICGGAVQLAKAITIRGLPDFRPIGLEVPTVGSARQVVLALLVHFRVLQHVNAGNIYFAATGSASVTFLLRQCASCRFF